MRNINDIIKTKEKKIIESNNKEMTLLKKLFDYLIKTNIRKY